MDRAEAGVHCGPLYIYMYVYMYICIYIYIYMFFKCFLQGLEFPHHVQLQHNESIDRAVNINHEATTSLVILRSALVSEVYMGVYENRGTLK